MSRGIKHETMPHGTITGYWRHMKSTGAEKTPCEPCRKAQREYRMKRYREKKRLGPGAVEATHTTSNLGAVRRIEALMFMGWTANSIGAIAFPESHESRGERSAATLVYAVRHKPRITYETALRIHRAYTALSHRKGPSTRTANWARSKGYAPPCAWDRIDDPKDYPKGVL